MKLPLTKLVQGKATVGLCLIRLRKKTMKNLMLLMILLAGSATHAQTTVDAGVKSEFDSLFKIQPKEIQDKRYQKGFENGLTLLTTLKEDTLNLKDYKPNGIGPTVSIIPIDDKGNEIKEAPPTEIEFNQWLSCQAGYSKDTLSIGSVFGLLGGFGFSLNILDRKNSGTYYEYSNSDYIFRLQLASPKATDVQVSAKASGVVLNEIPKKTGDVFYGKATLVTQPFYQDDSSFKKGFIHKRYTISFLFTCRLVDSVGK
ncbi:MAG: hypothetical protein EOO88_01330 [Pedobacter sp.]|nr:MAG: hypothetical protein EOO88_01330 [Pedobacter sp.]